MSSSHPGRPHPEIARRGHGSALLVPDAGPLITLGKSNQLPLLLLPGLPVYVVDQVVWEVTKDTRFPDAVAIDEFIRSHPDDVRVFETQVGQMCARARAESEVTRQPGMGEAAIAEFVNRIDEITSDPLSPAIVIFEDGDVAGGRFTPGPNTRRLSTWTFVKGLAEAGLLNSFEEAWAAIEATGRSVPKLDIDEGPTIGGIGWRG